MHLPQFHLACTHRFLTEVLIPNPLPSLSLLQDQQVVVFSDQTVDTRPCQYNYLLRHQDTILFARPVLRADFGGGEAGFFLEGRELKTEVGLNSDAVSCAFSACAFFRISSLHLGCAAFFHCRVRSLTHSLFQPWMNVSFRLHIHITQFSPILSLHYFAPGSASGGLY